MDEYKKGVLQTSENILTRYHLNQGTLEITSKRSLGHGTDPRVVSDGKVAFIFHLMRRDGETERAFYRVRKLPEDIYFDVKPIPGHPLGKNWQPFLKDGKLFAIYGFDPLTVLEIRETGDVEIVHQAKTQLDIAPPHEPFTLFRGGTNGVLEEDGCFYGFGHSTLRSYRHDTFMWRLAPDGALDIRLSNATLGLQDAGYGITDPTSLFEHDGTYFLGLAMSERDWFYEQKFADLLLRLPERNLARLFQGAASPIPNITLPNTDIPVRSIAPATCPSPIGVKEPKGALQNRGRAGVLLQDLKLATWHNGHPLSQVRLYFARPAPDAEASQVTATLTGAQGTHLQTELTAQQGKFSVVLPINPPIPEQETTVTLRVDCTSGALKFENIRPFYGASQSSHTNGSQPHSKEP